MLVKIDKKMINQLRIASAVFLLLVVLFIVSDYLLFVNKRDAITAKIDMDQFTSTKLNPDTLIVELPFVIENKLLLSLNSRYLKVTFDGKDVPVKDSQFEISSDSNISIKLPITFLGEDIKSSGEEGTPLVIDYTVGSFYRTWSGSTTVNLTPKVTVKNILNNVIDTLNSKIPKKESAGNSEKGKTGSKSNSTANDYKYIKGSYELSSGLVKCNIEIENIFDFPITIDFQRSTILKTGSGAGTKMQETDKSFTLKPKEVKILPLNFKVEAPKVSEDKDYNPATKTYKVANRWKINLFNQSDSLNIEIVLKKK
jgi:hypothetical protein